MIFAYKGVFNRNIDQDWTGGFLMSPTKISDRCHHNHGYFPNPVKCPLVAIAFNSGYVVHH